MYYVCIENDQIVSMVNYKPQAPAHVQVCEITDNDYALIASGTHYFNVEHKHVQVLPAHVTNHRLQQEANVKWQKFLDQTDWQVLRHIRQKALNLQTTLTEQQYMDLELARHQAAHSISKSNASTP